jgi:hypothetical protein
MGRLKMLINEHSQEVPSFGLLHSFDVLPHCSKGIFLFFINHFGLTCLCLWLPSFGLISHPFSAIPLEVPREFAIVTNPFFLVTVRGFCDVHIHAILWMDMLVVSLLVKQLQEVHFLLACIFSISLGQFVPCF